MNKPKAVEARGRGRNVEVSTASESLNKLTKFGRQMFPKDQRVTRAQAVAKALRKLGPALAEQVGAELRGEATVSAETVEA